MKDNFYKYACLLLDKGLNIKKGQPLVITAPIESIEFIRVLSKCCLDRGIVDIYYDWFDDKLSINSYHIYLMMIFLIVYFLIRKFMMNMRKKMVLF